MTHFGSFLILTLKPSNKVILVLHLSSKASFTLSKLRFFGLRAPKTNSCYTTSKSKGLSKNLLGRLIFFVRCVTLCDENRGVC